MEWPGGFFESGRQASALMQDVLAATANVVVRDDLSEPHVTILVGVEEAKDALTGVVTVTAVGIDDLEEARAPRGVLRSPDRVTTLARMTSET